MSRRGEKKARKKQHFRENIESITMAIGVALLFKTFALEVSKIPSGSMQPTLMGSAAAGVFDRVLVDKLSFRYRDPRRWEIVVFKHPLERSRVMVKRLVGMPDEEIKIEHGDLWTRANPEADWQVLRRPQSVMDSIWKRVDVREQTRSSWEAVSGEGWSASGNSVKARGDGRVRYRGAGRSVVDTYAHGYHDSIRGQVAAASRKRGVRAGLNPVGDLRLEGEMKALSGTSLVAFELSEGARTYEFRLPGPAAAADAVVELRIRDSEAYSGPGDTLRKPERTELGPKRRLEAGAPVHFAVENLDDRLRLLLNSEVLVESEIEPTANQTSSASITVRGAGADFEDLMVMRDVYYVAQDLPRATVRIPPEHYFFLGDNTLDSADGRDWKAVRLRWSDALGEDHEARGNYRGNNENPTQGQDAEGLAFVGFRDEWGNHEWIPETGLERGLPFSAPLVPRSLVQGRALAVFWPLQPGRGLWRLGWLR